jgi:hypothetical protein
VAVLTLAGGCMTAGPAPQAPPLPPPDADGPAVVLPEGGVVLHDNPLLIHLNASFDSYRKVFDVTLSTLSDFGFRILESNMHDGHIETVPRTAPGLGLFLKPGNPDLYDRLLCTLQSYRHRCFVLVQPAGDSGYFISLTVFKELEDLPRPNRQTAGAAVFSNINNVERQYDVIDPTIFESRWIPRGRDVDIEQLLLERIKCKLPG